MPHSRHEWMKAHPSGPRRGGWGYGGSAPAGLRPRSRSLLLIVKVVGTRARPLTAIGTVILSSGGSGSVSGVWGWFGVVVCSVGWFFRCLCGCFCFEFQYDN